MALTFFYSPHHILMVVKIFPDAACHRQILDLTVKCPHFGCSWTGELRAVEKHQSECPFKVVKCSNSGCTEKITKQALQGHMANECSWRKVNCEYCRESFIVNQKQEHFGVCGKFPVQCSNKCGLRDIPREKLEVHVRDECPATEVQCEYKNLGCEEVFPRSNAKSHSESQVERHLNLALCSLETTQLQVHELVSLVKDQSQKIERQSQQIERLMSKDEEQSQQIERLMSKNEEQSQQIERLMSKDEEQSQQIERLMTKNEEESQQIERLNCAPFIWKISNFQAIYDRAVRGEEEITFSDPFYLTRCGYKLRIKLFPNGSAAGSTTSKSFKGKYLSLYITVVPGEYDGLLPWPIEEEVRVTLIDQEPRQDIRKNISKFVYFKGTQCSRPKSETRAGFGFGGFVEQNVLKTRSYLNDNTLFIMVNKKNAE